jgi:hypothetical protein
LILIRKFGYLARFDNVERDEIPIPELVSQYLTRMK